MTGMPYRGRTAVLATTHGKERAVAPALERLPGLSVVVPSGIDTDALGTFTGEIPRRGSMQEAAIAKARLGMRLTGLPLGLASEGGYGPHPSAPFVPVGIELMVLVDDEREVVIAESAMEPAAGFDHAVLGPGDDPSDFLRRAGFPERALVARPNEGPLTAVAKGIADRTCLAEAIAAASALSADGKALVQTDMRAHCNPARMAAIARLAAKFAGRLASLCPECGTPGFGKAGLLPGLPCRWCGGPTTLPAGDLFRCVRCACERPQPRADGLTSADPGHCPECNP